MNSSFYSTFRISRSGTFHPRIYQLMPIFVYMCCQLDNNNNNNKFITLRLLAYNNQRCSLHLCRMTQRSSRNVTLLSLAAVALKCYVCGSSKSMSDCKKYMKEIDCKGNSDRCVSLSLDVDSGGAKYKSFGKNCYNQTLCETQSKEYAEMCKKIDGATCELDCCDTDGCNSGTATAVSVTLMMVCAFMALFR